jgi:hypothetical protein
MAPDGAAGAEEAAIAIPDAILAIRTFPRRFREALDRIPPDRLQARPDPQTWSALERAAHAGHVLDGLARTLPRALDEPGIHRPAFDEDGPPPAPDHDALLAALTRACEALTSRAEGTPWEAWDRTFTLGDDEHPAAWIVQHAAVVGSHDLREIERVGRLVGARGEDD